MTRVFFCLLSLILMIIYFFTAISYFVLNLDFDYDLGFLGIHYRPWRLLALVLASPLGLSALALCYFYESPKFLANLGKTDEAISILAKICKRNGGDGENYPVSWYNNKYIIMKTLRLLKPFCLKYNIRKLF